MAINRINETDLQGKLVSQLSNRPTDPRTAGGDNMTAQQVKARHDALGLLVKDKLNELLDALNNATVNGEPVTPLSDLITVVADGVSKSLTEWIEAKLTKSTTAGEGVHAYGVDDDGEQTMLPVSDVATEGAIPQYGTGGVLPVADGTADGHAMNKGQVYALVEALADAITAKYTKPSGGIPLEDLASSVAAVISDALKWSNADASATPAKLVMRDFNGVAYGATYGASANGKALVNKEQFEPVKALAEGASQAAAAENYSALVGILSEAPKTKYKAGQRFLIGTYGVPDVGILSVEDTAVSYTYTTDGAFEASLMAGTLQIGYFVLRPIEGKTNLEGYATETFVGNAISGNIDATLDTAGKSADAKAVGNAIDALIDGLVEGIITVAEAEYANASTYSQQAAHAEVADEANSLKTSLGVTDETPTAMQPVGGSSDVTTTYQKLNKLVGCKVVKNQLVQNGNFASTSGWNANGGTFSVNDNIGTLTVTNAAPWFQCILRQATTAVVGHKYLLSAWILSSSATKCGLAMSGSTVFVTPTANTWTFVQGIVTVSSVQDNHLSFGYEGTPSVGDTLSCRNFTISNLTLRYGNNDVVNAIIGNDSSKYVEKLLAFDPNILVDTAYDMGSFSSCKSAKLLCKRFNQYNGSRRVGYCNSQTGIYDPTTTNQHCSEMIWVIPNKQYYIDSGAWNTIVCYGANEDFLAVATYSQLASGGYLLTFPVNTYFAVINFGTRAEQSYCLSIYWDGSRLTPEDYKEDPYPLPNIDLNGILTVKNGKVVADGDEEYPSGEGNATRYAEVDFTALDWTTRYTGTTKKVLSASLPNAYISKQLTPAKFLSTRFYNGVSTASTLGTDVESDALGVYSYGQASSPTSQENIIYLVIGINDTPSGKLIYELATPTALTAPTFPAPFFGDDFGVMFFLDEDGNVIDGLQGNEIFYKANVAGFAESLYSEAEGDPDYFEAAGDVPTDIANYLKGLTGYDAAKTQTLKNVTGTLTWVDDV